MIDPSLFIRLGRIEVGAVGYTGIIALLVLAGLGARLSGMI